MNFLRNYLATPPNGQPSSGAETVERLCDRVQSSTLLEDRRDAVRALKSLSKKYRLEVGSRAMGIIVNVLQTDRNDTEILGYAVETLCNLMSNEPPEDEEEPPRDIPEDLGAQFADVFIKEKDNISLLLSLLEEYDFHVRWPTVKLLTLLLINKGKELQEVILTNPMGVSKMMDLLSDSREIIRNDGLLLLIQLTKSNTNIQKIVAFENAFERLFDIVTEEGFSDGGIIIEDCLLLLNNLLKNNSSNQNFFKEGSYIQRIPPFFELDPPTDSSSPQGGWSAQKVTNIHLMLQLVRTLVSPNNPQAQTTACQKVVNQCGLLSKLSAILMASGVPADVLTETINTVSEIIRGNQGNQEYFASVLAPSNPPRPAIVVLLMSMVNEKQPFVLRCAVLYCFQSFLYKNELGQSQIIATLLPSTAELNTITSGQLLCGGLFSTDPLSTWFAAVALLHSVLDNATQKEQLLRVQLATSLGNPPVSLLQQCSNILAQGAKLQTRVGLLMLLSQWMANCPVVVNHFLSNNANVPFLISQVSASEGDELELIVQGLCAFLLGICVVYNSEEVEGFHTSELRQIIEKRIGLEQFTDKLSQVTKHEAYSRAAKKPQINYNVALDIIFDHEFTKLFKKLESEVLQAVSPGAAVDSETQKKKQAAVDQHEAIVAQYKEIIREQDAALSAVKAELSETQGRDRQWEDTIQQLRDQNALLKAQNRLATPVSSDAPSSPSSGETLQLQLELDAKNKQLEEQLAQVSALKSELSAAESRASPSPSPGDGTVVASELAAVTQRLSQKEEEVTMYRGKYEDSSRNVAELREQLSSGQTEDRAGAAVLEERNSLSRRVSELELSLAAAQIENKKVGDQRAELETKVAGLREDVKQRDEMVKTLESDKAEVELEVEEQKQELEAQRKEQEDLLVLLADQDTKLREYRGRLKAHGETVSDDEDDDDDDEDEEEDGEENDAGSD